MTLLAEITRERAAENVTLVVPVGATEQHGPQLPVGVDHLVVAHVARAAAERVGDDVLVAPVVAFGSSHHHLPYAGTLSLRSRTLAAVLEDLVASAAAWGVRRVVLLNGHGGNEDIVGQVARDAVLTAPLRVAAASYWTLAWSELCEEARRRGIAPVPGHAGGFETSVMLALRGELVDGGALGELGPGGPEPSVAPAAARAHVETHGWVQEIDGYTDDARNASAEAGEAFLELAVAATARLIADLAREPITA